MLKSLKLAHVGPAPHLEVPDLGERLNIITGDNGLGKSFLLDVAWWALTREWVTPEAMARPSPGQLRAAREAGTSPTVDFRVVGESKTVAYSSAYEPRAEAWTEKSGRRAKPGLVIYARIDGSFAVWDPARNYWLKDAEAGSRERVPAYVFNADEVWNGLKSKPKAGEGMQLSNGLITDWMLWQKEGGAAFKKLEQVLAKLSESAETPLKVGTPRRVSLNDSREIPTLTSPWGEDVPLTHASAGVRRIVALAYFIVWSWLEHVRASGIIGEVPTNRIVFLIDEIEAHLHPRWQRCILRGLLTILDALVSEQEKSALSIQVITATHSPLIMASIEPIYDAAKDRVFDFNLTRGADGAPSVTLTRLENIKYGDAGAWLGSPAFDMPSGYAIETDALIERVKVAMRDPDISRATLAAIDADMAQCFSDTHPMLARWRVFAERKGWTPAN